MQRATIPLSEYSDLGHERLKPLCLRSSFLVIDGIENCVCSRHTVRPTHIHQSLLEYFGMIPNIRPRTIRRIRTFVWFALTYAIIGIVWEYIEISYVSIFGPLIGTAVGLALALMEETHIADFTRTMSFSAAILVKSAVYLAFIGAPMALMGLFGGSMQGLTLVDYFDWIFSADFVFQIALLYLIHLAVLFFRHLNKLLGPGTLVRYITGTYHKPQVEKRVFMFLDLKSSTMLAETLGAKKYYAFLNEFFRDLSEPILDRGAEIYQYVGDEVILTWPLASGLRDANCIRIFIEILAQIHSRRGHYLQEYGHVPEFKAGVHYGDVITAEIGDIKKEISYFGDVLNTAARIQSKCNEMGQLLIASDELVAALELPEFIHPKRLGEIALRGKSEATALVGLYS